MTCASYTWKVKLMNLLFSNFYGRNCMKLYSPTAKSGGNFVEVNKAALKTTASSDSRLFMFFILGFDLQAS